MADAEDDDARHRREERERREKRKQLKSSKSDSARHRDVNEYRRRILEQQGIKPGTSSGGQSAAERAKRVPRSPSSHKKHKKEEAVAVENPSAFQNLFTQRGEGFQIEFKFRNAPPRPPVGPCFVGHSIDSSLIELCRQYKPFNAVEINHVWKLHSEPDLGVPLAPSAMDLKSYKNVPAMPLGKDTNGDGTNKYNALAASSSTQKLHPDDEALLSWKGSLGDTASENLKLRQDRARAAAGAALLDGKSSLRGAHLGIGGVISTPVMGGPGAALALAKQKQQQHQHQLQLQQQQKVKKAKEKKSFSRVLDESMQTWMKKTTYLSNDYSKNTHTFKSLAQTKQQQAIELDTKQQLYSKRRSSQAISASFNAFPMNDLQSLKHPTKKNLKAKHVFPLLPSTQQWKYPYTHLMMDKAPINVDLTHPNVNIDRSFVANVERTQSTNRLTCQLWIPPKKVAIDEDDKEKTTTYQPLQEYDLDVIPLKEEDIPHSNFVFFVDKKTKEAYYIPISSRVQLTSGRPLRKAYRRVARRELSEEDKAEMEEKLAEVDYDTAEKLGKDIFNADKKVGTNNSSAMSSSNNNKKRKTIDDSDNDDGENDFDDGVNDSGGLKATMGNDDSDDDSEDDDEHEATFGGATRTIIAE